MGSFSNLSDQKQESNKNVFAVGLGGTASPPAFMASSNRSSIDHSSSSTQLVLDKNPQQQQHQPPPQQVHQSLRQQQLRQEHHQSHHPHHQHQHQQNINQISFGMIPSSSSSSSVIQSGFIGKDSASYDLGELDQALFLYLDGQEPSAIQEQRHSPTRAENSGMRPPTLNIFPSQPMHVDHPSSSSAVAAAVAAAAKGSTTGLVSNSPPSTSGSKRSSEPSMDLSNPRNDVVASAPERAKAVKREGNRKGPTNSNSEHEGPKTPDPKTLRRLAQNREAARKSRLRKKAYVQQLESSRIKLAQLEQEIQRARAQGIYFGGSALAGGDQNMANPMGSSMSSEATVFDMEYSRWLDEHHRITVELRNAMQEHLQENELRMYVDNCLAHYDEVMNLKGMIAKSDVFHLVSGMWKTPAERCFMWMGGFRPSELIKIIMGQVEPLSEQQLLAICGVQQSTQEAEEALSQGLEALNQSLSDTIASDALSCPTNMGNYMTQMAVAMNKLSTLESFVRQADNLRHQTIHRMHQLLTTRQSARCFLAIAEYFHRLRALSSLWLARPRQE